MRPIEIVISQRRWPSFARRIAAITLWPFILYRDGYRTPALEAHEYYHWRQALVWGVLPWYAAYVVLLVVYRTGGRNHPMERRAYEIGDKIHGGNGRGDQ